MSELQTHVADAGLLSPHISTDYGGLGLDHHGRAVIFEEAGYSTLGSLALNVSAPDEGTAHLLQHVATRDQNEQWLRPHAAGDLRTCFAMSEPPGAGSDPAALTTTATGAGDGWRINGRKKWITGARGAAVFVDRSQVLGEVGKGFAYAQVRLAPARLTHCMRHLGGARRAHDVATEYVRERPRRVQSGQGRRL